MSGRSPAPPPLAPGNRALTSCRGRFVHSAPVASVESRAARPASLAERRVFEDRPRRGECPRRPPFQGRAALPRGTATVYLSVRLDGRRALRCGCCSGRAPSGVLVGPPWRPRGGTSLATHLGMRWTLHHQRPLSTPSVRQSFPSVSVRASPRAALAAQPCGTSEGPWGWGLTWERGAPGQLLSRCPMDSPESTQDTCHLVCQAFETRTVLRSRPVPREHWALDVWGRLWSSQLGVLLASSAWGHEGCPNPDVLGAEGATCSAPCWPCHSGREGPPGRMPFRRAF